MIRLVRVLAASVLVLAVLVSIVRIGAGAADSVEGGPQSGLADCQSAANCVSSSAVGPALAAPLLCAVDTPLLILREAIASAGWDIVDDRRVAEGTYLHVVATTRVLRFRDDVEFLIEDGQDWIRVRSASRLGSSDLGANRTRINRLRADLDTRCGNQA